MRNRHIHVLLKRSTHCFFLLSTTIMLLLCCSTSLKFIDKTTSIRVTTEPRYQIAGGIALPPDKKLFEDIVQELQKAFSKYPVESLKQSIDEVAVYKRLTVYGIEYAGTYHNRNIYVTLRDGLKYVENVFHHELNSILLKQHPGFFYWLGWHFCNPEGFEYWDKTRGIQYMEKYGTSQPWFDTTYLADGFLSKYSMSSLDNDLSRYAEALFMSKREFWDAYEKFERVRNKAKLAIEFYNKLHPIFTEEYFRKLGE